LNWASKHVQPSAASGYSEREFTLAALRKLRGEPVEMKADLDENEGDVIEDEGDVIDQSDDEGEEDGEGKDEDHDEAKIVVEDAPAVKSALISSCMAYCCRSQILHFRKYGVLRRAGLAAVKRLVKDEVLTAIWLTRDHRDLSV
jgi:hypothetical protein